MGQDPCFAEEFLLVAGKGVLVRAQGGKHRGRSVMIAVDIPRHVEFFDGDLQVEDRIPPYIGDAETAFAQYAAYLVALFYQAAGNQVMGKYGVAVDSKAAVLTHPIGAFALGQAVGAEPLVAAHHDSSFFEPLFSALVPVHKFQGDHGHCRIHEGVQYDHAPVARQVAGIVDIGRVDALGEVFIHHLVDLLIGDGQGLLVRHLFEGITELDLLGVFQIVVVGGDGGGVQAPFADGQIAEEAQRPFQGKEHAGQDQLDDQHKRHDRHGGGGGFDNGRNGQTQHICRIGGQEIGDEVFDQDAAEQGIAGRVGQKQAADAQKNGCLQQADAGLENQVRGNVAGDMQPGAMLPLDDGALFADGLDGVEDADPDTGRDQGETAGEGLHGIDEHTAAQHQRHKRRDHGAEEKDFPAAFIDEKAPVFAQINAHLGGAGYFCGAHTVPPAYCAYFSM